jgi:NitT/TauT family transport system permease protein
MSSESTVARAVEGAADSPAGTGRPAAAGSGIARAGLRSARRLARPFVGTAASFAVGIAVWYLAVLILQMKPYVLPYPHVVGATLFEERGLMFENGLVTLWEILAGFFVATFAGILIGMVLTFSALLNRLFYPLLVFLQATPKVALAPLFLAWFGFSFRANLAITVLIAIFPVIVNTMLGLQSIDRRMVELGRVMGASSSRLFWKIRLPIALPTILAGVKLAMTFAAIGAVIGELVAGTAGLGYIIADASGRLATDRSIAAIVVVSTMAVVLYFAVELVERILLRGHPKGETREATP